MIVRPVWLTAWWDEAAVAVVLVVAGRWSCADFLDVAEARLMRYGSLFSGVGGMDLGFDRAGFVPVFMAESDEYRRRVLRRHWPEPCIYDDVRAVRGSAHERLDVLSGGFPCQDVSVAGRRAGLAGARSGLFFEFARVADELVRPGGWIVIENVPGLFTSHGGRDFGVVVRTLGDLGFHDLSWRVLDSRYFGVPQRRRRVFIVARRADGECSQAVLLERGGCGWDFAEGGPSWAGVAAGARAGAPGGGVIGEDVTQALTTRFGNSGADYPDAEAGWLIEARALTAGGRNENGRSGPAGRRLEDDVNLVSAPVTAKWAKGSGGPSGDEAQNLTFVKRHGANTADDHETWDEADIARALNGMGQAGTNGALAVNIFPEHGQGADLCATETDEATGIAASYGKLTDRGTRVVTEGVFLTRAYTRGKDGELADTAPSLTKEADRGDGHPQALVGGDVRRLTPTECERLQALPDGWTYPWGPSLREVPFAALRPGESARAASVDYPPDGPRYAACGDAVTANVAEWIADRIRRVRAE